ncbi:HAD family hydrolase [Desulfosoma caldarium]|uniref:Putative hydrolase of the HAD superfamily n=1 Tax=Desulfosoma caldarium TaxID=610254 RepID=A0A3N1VLT7_9BACT|nr:HAD family phosphatase [Desulfosoma caldarium]ROR02900.1 putative hydrolase of the HAD superfamily [Desulfosoma caldarium]
MTGPPKAVLFDFGRVISAPKPASLFESYERDLKLPLGSLNRIMFDDPVWEDTLLGRRSLNEYWETMGPRLGLRDATAVAAFRARYDADEKPNTPVIAMIQNLHGRVALGVLSNAPRGLTAWLERWRVLSLFDVVVCSAEEGVRKPWKEAYRLALERLRVTPQEALFVDDTEENVKAAEALGMASHLYRDPSGLSLFLSAHGLDPFQTRNP